MLIKILFFIFFSAKMHLLCVFGENLIENNNYKIAHNIFTKKVDNTKDIDIFRPLNIENNHSCYELKKLKNKYFDILYCGYIKNGNLVKYVFKSLKDKKIFFLVLHSKVNNIELQFVDEKNKIVKIYDYSTKKSYDLVINKIFFYENEFDLQFTELQTGRLFNYGIKNFKINDNEVLRIDFKKKCIFVVSYANEVGPIVQFIHNL